MSKSCWRRCGTRGLTIVEVIAGLALLSTLLVSILVTYRAHAAQVRGAQDRLAAIEAADDLLTEWSAAGVVPAVGREERLPGDDGWAWRIVAGQGDLIRELGIKTVRLEIFRLTADDPTEALASVELLVSGGGERTAHNSPD